MLIKSNKILRFSSKNENFPFLFFSNQKELGPRFARKKETNFFFFYNPVFLTSPVGKVRLGERAHLAPHKQA
jgi:hypothetical protein